MRIRLVVLVSAMLFAFSYISEAQDKGKCGPNLTYKIERKKNHRKANYVIAWWPEWRYELTISGKGEMTEAPWRYIEDQDINSVIIRDGATTIVDHAFEGYSFSTPTRIGLSRGRAVDKILHDELIIPNTVTRIGDFAFKKCGFDFSPYIPDGVRFLGQESFAETRIHYKDREDWGYPFHVIGGYDLEEIGDKAFYGANIQTFGISPSVKQLGQYVFACNPELYGVLIDKGLKHLSEGTFLGCSGLKAVDIKNSSIITIDARAFEECSSLPELELPATLQSIGERSFLRCGQLKSIVIPDSVKEIGDYAFWSCSALSTLELPDSITSIGSGAFAFCSELSSFKSKWASRDNRCLIIDNVLIAFAPYQIKQYSIPTGVKSLGDYSFAGCTDLESVTLPEGLIEIGYFAFWYCTSLSSITIPRGVKTIRQEAFENCEKLEIVVLPPSVTRIEDNAFSGCDNLQYVSVTNKSAYIADNAFPTHTKVYYSNPNNPLAVLAIESLVLKDQYRSNVINGGTSNSIELTVKNEGYGYGKGIAKVVMSGTTTGLSASSVPFSVYQGESAVIRIPINADYSVSTGSVNLRVQLSLENGFSHGNDLITVQTQAHGVSANSLSNDGRRYKRAAEALYINAKDAEGILSTIKEYENLTKSDPYYADAYFNLGILYTSLAKIKGNPYFDKAIKNYRMFEKLMPEERQNAEEEIYIVQALQKSYKAY